MSNAAEAVEVRLAQVDQVSQKTAKKPDQKDSSSNTSEKPSQSGNDKKVISFKERQQQKQQQELQARETVSRANTVMDKAESVLREQDLRRIYQELIDARVHVENNPLAADEANNTLKRLEDIAKAKHISLEVKEADEISVQSRTIEERLVREWAKNAFGGTKVDIALGDVDEIKVVDVEGKKIVILPNDNGRPPTLKQLKETIRQIASDLDDMGLAQTIGTGHTLVKVARELGNNPTISDATVQAIYNTGEEIQQISYQQYIDQGGRIPGQPKSRKEIATQQSTGPQEPGVQKLIEDIEELSSKKESTIASSQIDFSQQVMHEFTQFVTGSTVKKSNTLSVSRLPDGKLEISLPPNPTLQDVVHLAQMLQGEEGATQVTQKIEQFANQLQDTGLLMAQSNQFSPEAYGQVYRTGQQLNAMLQQDNEDYTIAKNNGEIKETADKKQFSIEEENQLYLKMLLGKGVYIHGKNGMLESVYEKQFQAFQRRSFSKDSDASVTEEDFDRYILQRIRENDRYMHLVAQAVEKSLADENGRANKAMKEVAAQKAIEAITQSQVNEWIEAVRNSQGTPEEEIEFNQSIHKVLAQVRIQAENEDRTASIEEELIAINTLFQSQEQVGKLVYAPAEILERLQEGGPQSGEDHMWDLACNIKSVYEATALEKVYGNLGYSVIKKLDGNHVYLYLVNGNTVFRVDPSTPKEQKVGDVVVKRTGVERVTSNTEVQQILADIEDNKLAENGDAMIISSIWHNAARQLQETDPQTARQMLEEAIKAYPDNAMALYAYSQLGTDTFVKRRFEQRALQINPNIADVWKENKKMIGAWAPPGGAAINAEVQKAMDRLRADYYALGDIPERELDAALAQIGVEFVNRGGIPFDPADQALIDKLKVEHQRRRTEEENRLAYFYLPPIDRATIERDGPMRWFEKIYLDFAGSWNPGKMPNETSFQEFKKQLGDAVSFVRRLDPTITWPQYQNLSGRDERALFEALQDKLIQSMVASVYLENMKDEKLRASALESVKSLGLNGIEMLKRLGDGNVGAIATMYQEQLDVQRVIDGGFIKDRSMNDIPQAIVKRLMEEATMMNGLTFVGTGGFVERYKKKIDDQLAIKYPTIASLTHTTASQAQIDSVKDEAKIELQHDITAYFNIARWVSVASLDEAAVISKGTPEVGGDYGEHYSAWGQYADYLRYNLPTKAKRDLLFGDDENIGPYKEWVTKIALRNIGYMDENDNFTFPIPIDPATGRQATTEQVFRWAADALIPYEIVRRSDRIEDSDWRMNPYLTWLHEQMGYGKVGPVDYPDFKTRNNTKYTDLSQLEFGLFTQYRILMTGINENNDFVRQKREELARGNIATYMPDKVMQQVYEFNPQNSDFVSFFAGGNCAFLDSIVTYARANGYEYSPRPGYYTRTIGPRERDRDTILLTDTEARAHERYEVFIKYMEPLMTKIRREGYEGKWQEPPPHGRAARAAGKPVQFDFSRLSSYTDATGSGRPNNVQQLNDYFNQLTSGSLANAGGNLETMMEAMSREITRTGDDSISHEMAYDVRYLPMHYRTVTDEDLLLNIEENRKELSNQLEPLNRGVARLFDDLKDYDSVADPTFLYFFEGEWNNDEKIIEGLMSALPGLKSAFGANEVANYLLKNGAFYEFAMALEGGYEFLGINPHVRGVPFLPGFQEKCIAAKYLGPQIKGKSREELLQMHEKYFVNQIIGNSKDPEKAQRIERRLKKQLGIRTWDIWMKNRVPKGLLYSLIALFLEMSKEVGGDVIGAKAA